MGEIAALLQLADAAFPAGGFGHSFGLETAIVAGRVHDAATLEDWIVAYLLRTCATSDGAAMALLLRDDAALDALDARLDAGQHNAEIRRANRHLARATLSTFAAIGLSSAAIASYAARIAPGDRERTLGAGGDCAGIHALAAALGYAAIGAACRVALEAHAVTVVAGAASVAARSIPLGQRDTARVRWNVRGAIGTFVDLALRARDVDDLRSGAVVCEIDGLEHRSLAARLFLS